ncbi:hypothetical protein TNIN_25921 [Trichonephila inaurata madagascariensis]|uniref:WAP domain-containing protein n=1 Tax=Trichonephila inaurata madagascariensis TaxID=2747483 RepID=A0A8X7BN87_9ARAC|nr:hypothetical protein TNIN_25921 [Trichonephila inaurata madagascariensis]
MNKLWYTILLSFFFIHKISSSSKYKGKEVCPPNYFIACPFGRTVECCSSSDCPSDKVCCLFACSVSCMKPKEGSSTEIDADEEECEKLKDGISYRRY